MDQNRDEVPFAFTWRALKLLGRGLYSNPWNALAELVANGLDAGATRVYVYIDMRDKKNATVEVLDNGHGMSRNDINTYVMVGHDKRLRKDANPLASDSPRGRKGIGKLATLYLSPHVFITTTRGETTTWELDATRIEDDLDTSPRLVASSEPPRTPNDDLWSTFESGTRLTMLRVDLTGYGTHAVNALGARLANQFLLPGDQESIQLWLQTGEEEDPNYSPVKKSIAFDNMTEVHSLFPDPTEAPVEIRNEAPLVIIPASGLSDDQYVHRQKRARLNLQPNEADDTWLDIAADVDLAHSTYLGIPYTLTGWIGVHASIKVEDALRNDPNFKKNKFYNPSGIRLYVRGKLASDRLLSQLGLTGTYVNYIEGEISFDLLDEDSLPDIATSNRQDFDETDRRVALLRALVRPAVRSLIQGRNRLANEISAKVRRAKEERATASKKQFVSQLAEDFKKYEEIPESASYELQSVIANKIEGDIKPKESYMVFISHSSGDKIFANLLDELLRFKGAREDEIFYTSRKGGSNNVDDKSALRDVVRESILSSNTLVLYLTSKNFLNSQFCMFEAGASWATRAVNEYLLLNMSYETVPKWLTNGRWESSLLEDKTVRLTPETHNYIIDKIVNPMIRHLNRGRSIDGDVLIEEMASVKFPTEVELHQTGGKEEDYFNPTLKYHWEAIVQPRLSQYLDEYFPNEDDQ